MWLNRVDHPESASHLLALAIRPAFMDEGDIKEERGSWFRTIASADHRKLEWRAVLDFPNEALACEARRADLVVIGRAAAPGDVYSALYPGVAVLKIGRPTLVVPDGVGTLGADRVVIGWKDSREARRAVVDVLPFLRDASHVTVVEICEPPPSTTSTTSPVICGGTASAATSSYIRKDRVRCTALNCLTCPATAHYQVRQLTVYLLSLRKGP
jgi:hypothetical protein